MQIRSEVFAKLLKDKQADKQPTTISDYISSLAEVLMTYMYYAV